MTRLQVLEAMRNGSVLHMEYTEEGRKFWLDAGKPIRPDIGAVVCNHEHIQPMEDGLFGLTPQSFTYR